MFVFVYFDIFKYIQYIHFSLSFILRDWKGEQEENILQKISYNYMGKDKKIVIVSFWRILRICFHGRLEIQILYKKWGNGEYGEIRIVCGTKSRLRIRGKNLCAHGEDGKRYKTGDILVNNGPTWKII